MEIEKRILELLYFRDCVIIPGFGGLVARYKPALIKEESQIILPPAKEIGFNPELVQDDGILSAYISRCEKISVSDSKRAIDKYVANIFSRLAGQERVRFESIGVFNYARTGELIFRADDLINFLPDSYGLASIHFSRIEGEKENILSRNAIFKEGEKVKVVSLPGTRLSTERQRSIRRVAVAIPLLLAITLIPLNNRNSSRKGLNNASFFSMPSLTMSEIPGTNSQSEKELDESSAPSETRVISYEENQDASGMESFAIIAGSFSTEQNALKLSGELEDKGYKPQVWKASNGFFRVVLQSHDSMTSAKDALAVLRKELQGIEFWILQ